MRDGREGRWCGKDGREGGDSFMGRFKGWPFKISWENKNYKGRAKMRRGAGGQKYGRKAVAREVCQRAPASRLPRALPDENRRPGRARGGEGGREEKRCRGRKGSECFLSISEMLFEGIVLPGHIRFARVRTGARRAACGRRGCPAWRGRRARCAAATWRAAPPRCAAPPRTCAPAAQRRARSISAAAKRSQMVLSAVAGPERGSQSDREVGSDVRLVQLPQCGSGDTFLLPPQKISAQKRAGKKKRWAATPGLGRKERREANDKCVLVFAQLQTLSSVNELLLSPDLGILLE